jgi:branched-chain amino acid aminotransferase
VRFNCFVLDQNAERLQKRQRLLMPQVLTELFINAAKAVVKS